VFLDGVFTHAISNLTISCWVLLTGQRQYWWSWSATIQWQCWWSWSVTIQLSKCVIHHRCTSRGRI
jgi:hypothetical protein